ncbi:hypothetical protein NL676_002103 [Syzygium grande]|nr:hypothetical protein NL676_002103 [Syzygium grande]
MSSGSDPIAGAREQLCLCSCFVHVSSLVSGLLIRSRNGAIQASLCDLDQKGVVLLGLVIIPNSFSL